MNLKKIAGMCKSAGSFHVTNIVNDDGEVTDPVGDPGAGCLSGGQYGAHR